MGYICVKSKGECECCGECSHGKFIECSKCEKQIYVDNEYYEIDNDILCIDCVFDLYGHIYDGED